MLRAIRSQRVSSKSAIHHPGIEPEGLLGAEADVYTPMVSSSNGCRYYKKNRPFVLSEASCGCVP